jgi:glycosyltransferase involved in cell wall biosynthesis
MTQLEIALATFQSQRYLRPLLHSLFNQSDQTFSVLVADDGSTDATLDILSEFSFAHPNRIRVLQFEERAGGPCQNFSRLLDAAQAKYLMFCDHDDVWLPNKIETSLKRMREVEAVFGNQTPILVHTDLSVVDHELRPLFSSFSRQEKLSAHISNLRQLMVQNNVTGCTMLLNKALYEIARPIPHGAAMHDWWIALVAAAFGKVSFVENATVLYRQHERNSVGITKRRGWAHYYLKAGNFVRGRGMGHGRLLRITDQAQQFRDRYASRMSAKQYALFNDLASLWSLAVPRRLWILIANRFFAFRTRRTIELLIGALNRRSVSPDKLL